MSQTKEGAIKAMATIRNNHGSDFHKRIGTIGGSVSGIKKGFAARPELASIAGKKGGMVSRRIGVKNKTKAEREAPIKNFIKQSDW